MREKFMTSKNACRELYYLDVCTYCRPTMHEKFMTSKLDEEEHFIHVSCEIISTCQGFQNTVCAYLDVNVNESSMEVLIALKNYNT